MKKIVLFAVTVFLPLALLAGLSVFQISRLNGNLPDLSGAYCRAKVTKILSVSETREENELRDYSILFSATVLSGTYKGKEVKAVQTDNSYILVEPRYVREGDSVILSTSVENGEWYFAEFVRSDYLIVLGCVFLAVLLLFGRLKGLKTAISLLLTVAAVFLVFIPGVLLGDSVVLWTLVICLFIILSTLLIVNGYTYLSLSSILGCLGGVGAATAVILISKWILRLTGFVDEHSLYLHLLGISLEGILYSAMVIGCVGAIMDVAVNLSAALHELSIKTEKPTFSSLFKSGMTIGRDILGTMANTLILAYVGSTLCTIFLIVYYNATSPLLLFNKEIIVFGLLEILVGSLALLLTIPLSVLIASFLFTRSRFLENVRKKALEAEQECDDFTDKLNEMNRESGSEEG